MELEVHGVKPICVDCKVAHDFSFSSLFVVVCGLKLKGNGFLGEVQIQCHTHHIIQKLKIRSNLFECEEDLTKFTQK